MSLTRRKVTGIISKYFPLIVILFILLFTILFLNVSYLYEEIRLDIG